MKTYVPILAVAISACPVALWANGADTDAQASTPSSTPAESLNVPVGTAFLAKLSSNLTLAQCKPGDQLEAEARQDIKQGKQVLLKKGSTLLGHIAAVHLATMQAPQNKVEIVFDAVRIAKSGQQFSIHLVIQALAPEANVTNNDTLADGRGLDSATNTAGISGHSTTLRGNVNELTAASTGVYDISGVQLGDQVSGTAHTTILAASVSDFRVKKGMQLVLRVVEK